VGLFSDLFGSSSHTQTTESTSQVTNTQLAGGGIAGSAIYGSGNTVVATDAGAIQGATDISAHALALGAAEVDANKQVALMGIDAGANIGDKALDLVDRFSTNALNANAFIAGKSLDALSGSYSDSLTSVANSQSGTLAAVEQLASQVSQSSQQTSDKTVLKVVGFIALAVVALMVLKR